MNDAQNDIDALLRTLSRSATTSLVGPTQCARYHDALAALVAERDALKQRVAELEAQPQQSSDLRERLVCAIWPEILRAYCDFRDAYGQGYALGIAKESLRAEALEEADAMIAAMRKGGGA